MSFRRGELTWMVVDAGYRQMLEKAEIRRFELHLGLVAARALGDKSTERQHLQEYNQIVRQIAAWRKDYALWLEANPEPPCGVDELDGAATESSGDALSTPEPRPTRKPLVEPVKA